LLARYARTHGPFLPVQIAARFGLGVGAASHVLGSLVEAGRVIAGELIPKCTERAFVDAEVLRLLRRRSLARLRAEIEPVDAAAVGRFLPAWHGIDRPRRGREGLLAVVAQLEGAPLVASTLESEILSARIAGYATGDLDVLLASGEVVWAGVEPLGSSDGKIALFLADHEAVLARAPGVVEGDLAARMLALLDAHGALFFSDLVRRLGGYPGEIASTLWDLVWAGEVSNDTLMPLRAFLRGALDTSPSRNARVVPGLEGRWWRRAASRPSQPSAAERMATLARTLLDRHGVVTREVVLAEGIPGGFAAVYPALREMEARGQARRGYFVAGAGALQFAVPGADDRLRAHRDDGAGETRILAATDPANPYGASLSWPDVEGARFARAAGARVVLHDGLLVGFVGRGGDSLTTVLPDVEPARSRAAAGLARCLVDAVDRASSQGMLVVSVDGAPPRESPLAPVFVEAGFTLGAQGLARRRRPNETGRAGGDARR
jgi:ATP-dependent Lhr-like helicase